MEFSGGEKGNIDLKRLIYLQTLSVQKVVMQFNTISLRNLIMRNSRYIILKILLLIWNSIH